MKFVCPEIEGNTANNCAALVFKYLFETDDTDIQFDNVNGHWIPFYFKGTEKLPTYFFGKTNYLRLLDNRVRNFTQYTISTFASALGITITDYTDLAAVYFYFAIKNIFELISPYFFIIYTDNGIIFAKPSEITGAKFQGFINKDNVINKTKLIYNNVKFQGETDGDIYINSDNDFIMPVDKIGSTLKTAAINKYFAKNQIVSFRAGFDAEALDYCQIDEDIYIIMSKFPDDKDYIYTAVKKSITAPSFSGADISPFNYIYGEKWHYVGGSGEPAFQNSWANIGGSYQTLRYRKIGNHVEIEGAIKSGTSNLVFTIPAGYRPSAHTWQAISGIPFNSCVQMLLSVETGGAVYIYAYNSAAASCFPTAASNTGVYVRYSLD